MAQTFPMLLSEFFDGLPIKGFAPDLTEAMEFSRTKGGEIFTADNGPRLWTMDLIVPAGTHAKIEQIKAKLQLLRSPGRSLLVPSMPLLYPQADPNGSIIGSSVITLTDVQPNNREISLAGFPVGYEITAGDFMSFTYGSDPVRYAMHQFASNGVATGGGEIIDIEVIDFIRPGWAVDAPVRIRKPQYKAIVVPGSTEVLESDAMIAGGLKFSVIQTFR